MTDQGYSVCWDVYNELTGRLESYHRSFATHKGAIDFAATQIKPRIFKGDTVIVKQDFTEAEQWRLDHPKGTEAETTTRDAIAHANKQALVKLMLEYKITIPTKQFDLWRPTRRTSGAISGLHNNLEIIATDGLLAWFLTPEGDVWSGHIQCFDGKVEPLHGKDFDGTMTKKPKKMTRAEKLAFLLENL